MDLSPLDDLDFTPETSDIVSTALVGWAAARAVLDSAESGDLTRCVALGDAVRLVDGTARPSFGPLPEYDPARHNLAAIVLGDRVFCTVPTSQIVRG